MKQFFIPVDLRKREAMTTFLRRHFRYHTMNSWNNSTSYANCVKVYRLDLEPDVLKQAWDMVNMPDVYEHIDFLFRCWAKKHQWTWQIGHNGKSSGYVVLYRGDQDWENAFIARCDSCDKLTYHKQETPCTSRGCDGTLRVLDEPVPPIVTYPGRPVDQYEDFADWDMHSLRERVRLVQDFDRVCDAALAVFVGYCRNYDIVEQDVMVPKTIKVLEPV